jgi:hypothetical protein
VAILGMVTTEGSDSTYRWWYIASWALPARGAVGGWLVDRWLMKTLYAAEPSSAKVSVSAYWRLELSGRLCRSAIDLPRKA